MALASWYVRRVKYGQPILGVALVFLACFGAGMTASARWLPDLALGHVGGLAFTTVCILLGAALGMVVSTPIALSTSCRACQAGPAKTKSSPAFCAISFWTLAPSSDSPAPSTSSAVSVLEMGVE